MYSKKWGSSSVSMSVHASSGVYVHEAPPTRDPPAARTGDIARTLCPQHLAYRHRRRERLPRDTLMSATRTRPEEIDLCRSPRLALP